MTHTTRTPEDARTNPQPGDAIQWTGREAPDFVRAHTCVAREGAYLTVETTRYDGNTTRDTKSVIWWRDAVAGRSAWVYVPAPVAPGVRTPEDARLRPHKGDTLTIGERVYTVDEPRLECVRLWCTYGGVEEGTTWSYSTWQVKATGRTWAPAAPTVRDPRTDPQPGDVMRATHKGPTTAAKVMEWTVTERVGDLVHFRFTRDGVPDACQPPARDVKWWGSDVGTGSYEVSWHLAAPVPVRDPKTDPQAGDVKTWTSTEDAEYVRQEVVLARNDGSVEVQVTRFNGTTYTTRRPLGVWVFGADTHWTWTRGDETPAPPAPATAPEAPRAWYETRGLPSCLAALPTPTDGELEALDLWAALEGLGYLPTGADDSGRVTIAPDDATVYLGTNGRYAVQWDDGRVYPPGGLATAMAAYTRARSAYGRVVA